MSQQKWIIAVPPLGAARSVALDCVSAFVEKLGTSNVSVFDTKPYLDYFTAQLKQPDDNLLADLVNQTLIVQCLDFSATHLIVCALCPVTLFALNILKKQHIKTIHWFYEDFKRAVYWKEVCAGYDVFCAIQRGSIPEECEKHGNRFLLIPTAVASGTIPALPQNNSRSVAVAFIGIPSVYRIELLEYLAQKNVSLAIAGLGWNTYKGPLEKHIVSGNWTNASISSSILSSAKIGINMSVDAPENDRQNVHVSPRVFDVIACGCTLVAEDVPLAHETLSGMSYRTFVNKEDALSKINEALSEYVNTGDLREKNRAKIYRVHTYRNRVERIIDFCDKDYVPD